MIMKKLKQLTVLALALMLLVNISANCQKNQKSDTLYKDVCFTFNPHKNGVGISSSISTFYAAVEYASPKAYDLNQMYAEGLSMIKYSIGLRTYKFDDGKSSLNVGYAYNKILSYRGQKIFLKPDQIMKHSFEIGLIKHVEGNFIIGSYLDILNQEIKVGAGFNF